MNGDDVWVRKKSRRLPMIPGGIYSSKSGKFISLVKKKVFKEISKQCTDLMGARKGNSVKTKEYKPTDC